MIIFKNLFITLNKIGIILILPMFIVFGRTFSGLYLFNFRIAEYLLGYSLVVSFYYFFVRHDSSQVNKNIINLIKLHKFLLLISLLVLVIRKDFYSGLYLFKSSSYIWTISFFYLAYFLKLSNKQSKLLTYLSCLALAVLYIFNTTYFPNFIKEFFLNNSDKFDFVKASMVTMGYMFTILLARINLKKSEFFIYFFISSAVILPVVMYQSKGSFIGFLIYFIYILFTQVNFIKHNVLLSIVIIILSVFLFSISIYQVYGELTIDVGKSESEIFITEITPKSVTSKVTNTLKSKTTYEESEKLLYIFEGRVYSSDHTANWRLQIWQDVLFDLINENKLAFGYGFDDIIPAMLKIGRSGLDESNENVHNYFVNIFARGGLVSLFLILIYFYKLNLNYLRFNKKYDLFFFIVATLFVANFDPSMETVRVPLLFYYGCGYLYSHSEQNKLI